MPRWTTAPTAKSGSTDWQVVVRVAFDTSVIVASVLRRHAFHVSAVRWLDAVDGREIEGCLCAHALAETYSVLTKMPGGLTLAEAWATVRSLRGSFLVVDADADAYSEAVRRCATRSLKSGAVFDALPVIVAERQGAEILVTFNPRDFCD